MDAAAVNALLQLVALGLQTFEQYQNGTITADQAVAMLTQSSANLKNAIDAFNAAGTDPNAAA